MKRVPLILAAALLATAAAGQEASPEAARDLWCGIAFGIISESAPTDVNEEQQAIIDAYRDGGVLLVDRARTALLAGGFTEAGFGTYLETVSAEVTAQVNATDNSARFSFEECSALLEL